MTDLRCIYTYNSYNDITTLEHSNTDVTTMCDELTNIATITCMNLT